LTVELPPRGRQPVVSSRPAWTSPSTALVPHQAQAAAPALYKKTRAPPEQRKDRPACAHCGKTGHDSDTCWRKHPDQAPASFKQPERVSSTHRPSISTTHLAVHSRKRFGFAAMGGDDHHVSESVINARAIAAATLVRGLAEYNKFTSCPAVDYDTDQEVDRADGDILLELCRADGNLPSDL
jgi:hypothetical protein